MDFSGAIAGRATGIRIRANAASARNEKDLFFNRLRECVHPIKFCQSTQRGHET
jgi:hypothetical protein